VGVVSDGVSGLTPHRLRASWVLSRSCRRGSGDEGTANAGDHPTARRERRLRLQLGIDIHRVYPSGKFFRDAGSTNNRGRYIEHLSQNWSVDRCTDISSTIICCSRVPERIYRLDNSRDVDPELQTQASLRRQSAMISSMAVPHLRFRRQDLDRTQLARSL